MKDVTIQIQDHDYEILMGFKKVYDYILEEDGDMDGYFQIIILNGIEHMMKGVIPQDMNSFWDVIMSSLGKDPSAFSDLIIKRLEKGKIKKEELKEKLIYIA